MLSNGEGVSCYRTDVSHPLQHHCRACGQIFCGKCSSKYSTIPKFGIEKEVRVCEPCYEHLNKSVPFMVCFFACNSWDYEGRSLAWSHLSADQSEGFPSCAGWAGFPSFLGTGFTAVVLRRAGALVRRKEHSVCTVASF